MRKANVQLIFLSQEQLNGLCCIIPTLSSKRICAFELETSWKFYTLRVILVSQSVTGIRRSLFQHPGYQQIWICVFPLLSAAALCPSQLQSVAAKPQLCGESREQSEGQPSSLLGILSGLAFLGISFPDHPLLLRESYQTHPQPSHSALVNLDLGFL